jgi:hypothetical protein
MYTYFYALTAAVARKKCLIFYGSPHTDPDSAGFRAVPLSQAALARSPADSPILTRRRVQRGTA